MRRQRCVLDSKEEDTREMAVGGKTEEVDD